MCSRNAIVNNDLTAPLIMQGFSLSFTFSAKRTVLEFDDPTAEEEAKDDFFEAASTALKSVGSSWNVKIHILLPNTFVNSFNCF